MTPMMSQYRAIKEAHEGALLFFRLGDFYELFFEDAVETAGLLGLTLTGRGKGDSRVPMCGVPHHAVDSYIAKLTRMGKKVAICEQVSDPSVPGIVEREVARIVTPGTTMDEKVLDRKANNFVMALKISEDSFEIAYADVSTGEFKVMNLEGFEAVKSEIQRVQPAEIVVPADQFENGLVAGLRKGLEGIFFFSHEFEGSGVSEFLMDYLKATQKTSLDHMKRSDDEDGDVMMLDEATLKNLELLVTLREGKKEGSLLWVLDKTKTPMGGRMLRSVLTHPLLNKNEIEGRLDAVEELKKSLDLREELQEGLKQVMDLERLLARLSMGRGNARDLAGLKESLLVVKEVKGVMAGAESSLLKKVNTHLDVLEDVVELIGRAIVADPPINMSEAGIIADGYNAELDELNKVCREGKGYIQSLQQKEIERTGIANLKVRFNKVFGYYLEVSKGQAAKVPAEWIRKQTLVNAERFVTPELKEFEEKVLGAEEKIVALERKIFEEVRGRVVGELERIQRTARAVAMLDVMGSFAEVAVANGYCKPVVGDSEDMHIVAGRHPVVEKMTEAATFVPNDCTLVSSGERLHLITGPNMGGKSTYLRQVALTVLMAQIGSFVPAEKAVIALADRIFTRVGASDNLVRGQSTFMVEMQETALILGEATERSLVILDEIGRGTSTYDGMSLAWAIAEFLHDKVGAKTLFATHYHELISLVDKLENGANYSVAVSENDDGVVFLYKVAKGGVDRSYGIEVAKLAGLPGEVVGRARQILRDLEEGSHEAAVQKELSERPAEGQSEIFSGREESVPGDRFENKNGLEKDKNDPKSVRAHTFENRDHGKLKKELDAIDPNSMTPIEALAKLAELKKESK